MRRAPRWERIWQRLSHMASGMLCLTAIVQVVLEEAVNIQGTNYTG